MIDAIYFDGRSSRRHPVTVIIHQRVLVLRGEGLRRNIRVSKLALSERLQHAPRLLRFPDGALLEVSDPRLTKLLRSNRFYDSRVVRWQQNWWLALTALIVCLALAASAYQWGMPWAFDRLGEHLPLAIETKIGAQELAMLDVRALRPSQLAPEEQLRLKEMFARLKQPRGERTAYRLAFRHSQVGPNAFALPNGVIVLTDQLVQLAGDDQAVMGVLAHELGHVQGHHALRHLMQALGLNVVLNLWIGDVSSALAAVPTFFLDQKYSRDFERAADRYAIDMMHASALPLTPLAQLFATMQAQHDGAAAPAREAGAAAPAQRKGKRSAAQAYFSSHPSDAERIAYLRAADPATPALLPAVAPAVAPVAP